MTAQTLDRYIDRSPDVAGGKPRLAGRRITVQNIVIWHEWMGYTADDIATEYDLALAEIYAGFPEVGDLEKPRLVIFIDEAHLVFDNATKTLIHQIESIIKLIRSKGVGIFFCTQNPMDIPDDVLSQLGMKVQHALRAFTAKDRKEIKQTEDVVRWFLQRS